MPTDLASILQTMLDGVVAIDAKGCVVGWNAVATDIFGWTGEEALGQSMGGLIVPRQHRAAHSAGMVRFQKSGVASVLNRRIEITAQDRTGREFPIELAIVEAPESSSARFIGFIRDISQEKSARDRLALSEESLRLATDAAEVGTWDLDLATNELTWSDRTKAMFGISPDIHCSMDDFYAGLHPEDRPAIADAFAAALDPERRATYDVEYRTIGKEDGITRWVGAKGRGVFDVSGVCVRAVGTAIDITSRKRDEVRNAFMLELADMLRGTETDTVLNGASALMGRHFGVSRVGYGRLDAAQNLFDYDICWTDGTVPPLLGRFPAQAFGAKIVAQLAAGETVVVDDLMLAEISDEAETRATAESVDTRSILVVPFLWAGQLRAIVYLNGRSPRSWTADEIRFMEEVAERTREVIARAEIESELRQLNARLEARVRERTAERNLLATLFEETDAFVHVVDLDYRWLAINRAGADEFERVFGVRPKVGDRILDLLDDQPQEREAVKRVWSRALAGEQFTGISEFGDPRIVAERRSYEMKFNMLRDEEGRRIGAFQVVADVTERLRAAAELEIAQEALRQSQKMEAMGQLTGGVAHDFNNLLTPIVGSLDFLHRKQLGGEREQRLVDGALQSAERAKTLVQRLLAFARRQPLLPEAVDVGTLIEGMCDLVASTSGPRVRVELDLARDLPPAVADANQLEMAILNLAVNARDAMPDGGRLTLGAQAETVRSHHSANLAPGGYVRLSVADTGIGMDEATIERAVEPFFSTKGIGKGTGLGLSMVHGLVAQLGGALTIRSRPGLGTCVELWLPASADAVSAPAPTAGTEASVETGTVLLVDDEELVRLSTADMLADLGYEVVEADSAESALRLVDAGTSFDLLTTDHLMPGMSGTELVRQLRARKLSVPVLIVSGYAEIEELASDLPRLTKPFRQVELAMSIAELKGGVPARVG